MKNRKEHTVFQPHALFLDQYAWVMPYSKANSVIGLENRRRCHRFRLSVHGCRLKGYNYERFVCLVLILNSRVRHLGKWVRVCVSQVFSWSVFLSMNFGLSNIVSAQKVSVEEFTLSNGMQFLLVPRTDQPNVCECRAG